MLKRKRPQRRVVNCITKGLMVLKMTAYLNSGGSRKIQKLTKSYFKLVLNQNF